MDDLKECADLCEQRGFAAQAERLRAVAEGRARAYIVMERPRGEDGIEMDEGGTPLAIHSDREGAERDALRRNIRDFRERDRFFDYNARLGWGAERAAGDLEARIGQIFGRDFTPPDADSPGPGPIIPASATDEQMGKLIGLFSVVRFYVAEAELVG